MRDFNIRRFGPEPKYPNVLAYPKYPQQQELITIAGPCFMESGKLCADIAKELSRVGVTYMRGGVYRAGTYPPDNFGFNADMLREWYCIAQEHNLKIIVECLDVRLLPLIWEYADAIQIGSRAMQNYALLKEVSQLTLPVFLKRNQGATLDEFLGAAEYLCKGNCKPHLIERGSTSGMNHVRWELSVSMIAAIKQLTGIPVIVDAAHGSGRADLVEPLTLAGIAAGADGFLVEIHTTPEQSLSDSLQALPLEKYAIIKAGAEKIKQGR